MAALDPAPLLRWDAGSKVLSLAISRDGTRVASGSHDKIIRVWDVKTGALVIRPLIGHAQVVQSVAWSHDDTMLVSGSWDGTIRIWDAYAGSPIGDPPKRHSGIVNSVSFSHDSTRIVSGSYDSTICIWEARTGIPIGNPISGHTDKINSVAFSSNDTQIVSGSYDNTIRIWDTRTGASIGSPLNGHSGRVWSVAFSHDSTRIVSGSFDSTIRIWDTRTGGPIGKPLRGHTDSVLSAVLSPGDTHIVSGSKDKTIRIWDARTGAPIGEPLRGHTSFVESVAFSPDSKCIISGSADKSICVWETLLSPPSFDMVTSDMSVEDMFACLVKHGCTDLTSSTDMTRSSPVITSGGFGDVRRLEMDDGNAVAIKTLRLHVLLQNNDKALKRAIREVYIWHQLCHVNVQELLGIIVFQGGLGMVSAWREQGNLQQYIAANPDVERYPLCVQLAAGVSYLHAMQMVEVHGDLKASNVLVSDNGTLKISDFDYAILPDTSLHFSTTTRFGGGTPRWMAPELLLADEDEDEEKGRPPVTAVRSKSSDMYALGMTMLEILTGKVPYAEYRSNMGVLRAMGNKQFPRRPAELSGHDTRSDMMWRILVVCWDHDPNIRPVAPAVLELLEFKRLVTNK